MKATVIALIKNCLSNRKNLLSQLRLLWSQHVYWTRFFIISTAAGLGDLDPVTKRLLRNPNDFAKLLVKFYGSQKAGEFNRLLTEHLMIAADLVNAVKAKNTAKVDEARNKWYHNADEIAEFLHEINPFWSEQKWKDLFYDHLRMTEKEAVLRLSGNFAEDVKLFDSIENEAMEMAEYMFRGIVNQFRLC